MERDWSVIHCYISKIFDPFPIWPDDFQNHRIIVNSLKTKNSWTRRGRAATRFDILDGRLVRGDFFVRLIKDYCRDIADDLRNAADVAIERVRALFAGHATR